jgi:hypothetical protein
MLPIDNELIKRVENGDLIVRGSPDEIQKSNFEDGWYVLGNLRESEELELERSGLLQSLSSTLRIKNRLPYAEFVDNDWYIMDKGELNQTTQKKLK